MTAYARASSPHTSWDAAHSLDNLSASQRALFRLYPSASVTGGLTDEQLQARARVAGVQISDSGIRTRRVELVRQGLLVDSGLRGWTHSHHAAIVWRVRNPAEGAPVSLLKQASAAVGEAAQRAGITPTPTRPEPYYRCAVDMACDQRAAHRYEGVRSDGESGPEVDACTLHGGRAVADIINAGLEPVIVYSLPDTP